MDGSGRRAQNSEREVTVLGWEGGPQDSAAIRDFAQGVDERERKGATLRKRSHRSPSARHGGNCWNLRKTWMLASARAQRSERELTVPRPQSSAAIRDFAQDVDGSERKGATLGKLGACSRKASLAHRTARTRLGTFDTSRLA